MASSVHPKSAAIGAELARFEFRIASSRIFRGVLGGLAVLLVLVAWGKWTGRLENADQTYWAIVGSCAVGAALFVGWRVFSEARNGASAAGAIEVDSLGIRALRGDGTIGFAATWDTLQSATVDQRNHFVLFQKTDSTEFLIKGIDGNVDLDRFAEFEQLLASKITLKQHVGSIDRTVSRPAAYRATRYGAVCVLVSIALYGTNFALGNWFHWTRFLALMPVLVAGAGIVTLAASLSLWFDRGPLISPIYSPAYPRAIVRFLVIAVVANFVVIAVENIL